MDKSSFNKSLLPPVMQFTGPELTALRQTLGISRPVLAMLLNSPVGTVRTWERTGVTNGPAEILLTQLAQKGVTGYLGLGDANGSDLTLRKAAFELVDAMSKATIEGLPEAVMSRFKLALGLSADKDAAGMFDNTIRLQEIKAVMEILRSEGLDDVAELVEAKRHDAIVKGGR